MICVTASRHGQLLAVAVGAEGREGAGGGSGWELPVLCFSRVPLSKCFLL